MTQIRTYSIEIVLLFVLLGSLVFFGYLGYGLVESSSGDATFSGERALAHAAQQVEFGPRISGTDSNLKVGDMLIDGLTIRGWDVVIQPFRASRRVTGRNIVAIRGNGPVGLVGAQYDTRIFADADERRLAQYRPTPGANVGASGAAILFELAGSLDVGASGHTICLVFFDAQDNGDIRGWDWNLGSRYFVQQLANAVPRCHQPAFAVLLDAVGSPQLQVGPNPDTATNLGMSVGAVAAELGYGQWIVSEPDERTAASQRPFRQAMIPTLSILDPNYPYRHTAQDTADKISAANLSRIGHTLEVWLERGAQF